MYKRRGKKGGILLLILLVFGLLSAGGIYYIQKTYTIHTVYVDGNVHYTQEEIKDIVMKGPLGENSLYLSFLYRQRGVEDIPFVDAMDVSILAPDTIKITVYEKALAGYVNYLDTYMYFDKDGYVVESSAVKTIGVPQIAGLAFDYVVLGERLPVQDEGIFNSIMNITNLMKKYELQGDKIFFNSSEEIIIYFGEIKTLLGDNSGLEEKIMRLPQILEKLGNQVGTLHLESANVTFEPD